MTMARVTGIGWGPFRGLAFSWVLALCACPGTSTQDAGVDLTSPPADLVGTRDLGDLAPPPADLGGLDLTGVLEDLTSPPADLAADAGGLDLTSPPVDQGGPDSAVPCGQQDQTCCPGRLCASGLVCGTSDRCEPNCNDGNPCTVDRYVAGADGGSCEFLATPVGTVCRPAVGVCDTVEVCDGVSQVCPSDVVVSAGAVCRTARGTCDPQEVCDGASPVCPTDILAAQGTVCRPSTAACDAQEVCNGVSPSCPPDALAPQGTLCRAATAACDAPEVCNGVNSTCPPDAVASAGTLCRASAGACDVVETCSGTSAGCPTDRVANNGVLCRGAAGACDTAEACNGVSTNCPTDSFLPSGVTCRSSAGLCDVSEVCSGISGNCPTDSVTPAGVACRTTAGICDASETCNGASPSCPTDQFQPAGTTCRAATGLCDVAETCSGTSVTCPTDRLATAGAVCRTAAGICDAPEACDGVTANCPTDQFQPTSTVCRAGVGGCDVAETCTGTAVNCPSDRVAGAGVVCRPVAAVCDAAESCDGLAPNCPTDGFQPASVLCRASAGPCDVAENCSGSMAPCPSDVVVAAGTVCRTAADLCDATETCNGSSGQCPADATGGGCQGAVLAGRPGAYGYLDGTGATARFNQPAAAAFDGVNTLYIADSFNGQIRSVRVDTGQVSTLGATGTFTFPTGLALDGLGNLYVVDAAQSTVQRVVLATGQTTTIAGTAFQYGSTDGTGAAAQFDSPEEATYDGAGNLYVADRANHTIRRIVLATGQVTTIAGLAGSPGSTDGVGSAARFNGPAGLVHDRSGSPGTLYVADTENQTLRRINLSTLQVTTVAGLAGSLGYTDGTGSIARFYYPDSLAYAVGSILYVADRFGYTIRRVAVGATQATTAVTTLAGLGGAYGSRDGTGTGARFDSPEGLAYDATNQQLFVAENPSTIRRVAVGTGVVTTLAGSASTLGQSADGTGSIARFNLPQAVVSDGAGLLYVADRSSHIIRRIVMATGQVTTLAGSAFVRGSTDGSLTAARFNNPRGLAYDSANLVLYVAEESNHTIRRIDLITNQVTTLAGTAGSPGNTNGTGSAASFNHPYGLALDGAGYLYVADQDNYTIRRIDLVTGAVTTLAGTAGSSGTADGTGTAARFDAPAGLVYVGPDLYVSEQYGNSIRRVTLAGQVTTIAGGTASGANDGIGTAASFYLPRGLAHDGAGHLFIADTFNHTIRRLTLATAEVTTVLGNRLYSGIQAGPPAIVNQPAAVAFVASGILVITDDLENVVVVANNP